MKTLVKSNGRTVRLPGRPRWRAAASGWRMFPLNAKKGGSFAGVTPRNLKTAIPFDFENEDPAAVAEQKAAFASFLRRTDSARDHG